MLTGSRRKSICYCLLGQPARSRTNQATSAGKSQPPELLFLKTDMFSGGFFFFFFLPSLLMPTYLKPDPFSFLDCFKNSFINSALDVLTSSVEKQRVIFQMFFNAIA